MVTSLSSVTEGLNSAFLFVLFEAVSVTIQILSLVFNGAVICTLWKKSLLQYPSNRFVQSLCLSHLLVSLLIVLISIIQPFLPNNRSLLDPAHFGVEDSTGISSQLIVLNASFRLLLSHTILYSTFGVVLGTSLTVAFISIDRYITIAKPMKYKQIVTPKRTTGICFTIWLVCLLAAVLPILVSDNETLIFNSSFAIPIGGLRLYFAIVFLCVTTFSLVLMLICYFHIYTIAKEKCLSGKVQIGHFTSPPSSISSADWPSSQLYTSQDGVHHVHHHHRNNNNNNLNVSVRPPQAGAGTLLHWVLLTNAERNVQPLRMGRNESKRAISAPDLKEIHPKAPRRTRSWRTFLKPNYNSPRKTCATIFMLVGSVILTQFPLIWVLFTPNSPPFLFFFCYKVLFAISSLSNPVLYGLLNRSIRIQLWRLLRLDARKRRRTMNVKNIARKPSISSGATCQIPTPRLVRKISVSTSDIKNNNAIATPHIIKKHFLLNEIKRDEKIEEVKMIENPRIEIASVETPKASREELVMAEEAEEPTIHTPMMIYHEEFGLLKPSTSFSRKSSQDSGADMSFSDNEDEEMTRGDRMRRGMLLLMASVRSPETIPEGHCMTKLPQNDEEGQQSDQDDDEEEEDSEEETTTIKKCIEEDEHYDPIET